MNSSGSFMGDMCPVGAYCLAGSSTPTLCPQGTFASTKGNQDISGCLPCSAGFYCPSLGVSVPLPCYAGSYCPVSTITPQLKCPTGTYCPPSSMRPLACAAGTYQSHVGNSSCTVCPKTYYCLSNTTTPIACPPGSYCPQGTVSGVQYLCPNGTYSSSLNLGSVSGCVSCTPGMYCGSPGLTAPMGPCKVSLVACDLS